MKLVLPRSTSWGPVSAWVIRAILIPALRWAAGKVTEEHDTDPRKR